MQNGARTNSASWRFRAGLIVLCWLGNGPRARASARSPDESFRNSLERSFPESASHPEGPEAREKALCCVTGFNAADPEIGTTTTSSIILPSAFPQQRNYQQWANSVVHWVVSNSHAHGMPVTRKVREKPSAAECYSEWVLAANPCASRLLALNKMLTIAS